MSNEVEIRFRVTDEKTTPQAATPSKVSAVLTAPSVAASSPATFSQKERDVEERLSKVIDTSAIEARFEKMILYRMKRLGARLIASAAVTEIGGALGLEDAFVSRLGVSAISGAMMGGPALAAVHSLTTIVHELINQVKGQREEVKRLQQLAFEKTEKQEAKFLEFKEDLRRKAEDQEAAINEKIHEEAQRVNDYLLNAAKYITVPYKGVG